MLGSGFAGLWAALGAARRIDELDVAPGEVNITVVSSLPYHGHPGMQSRGRPDSVPHSAAGCARPGRSRAHRRRGDCDRAGFSHGGHLPRYSRLRPSRDRVRQPSGQTRVPGLRAFGFDVDTYDGAVRLQRHLVKLASGLHTQAAATAIVVGAGLTGIETACELPARLAALFPDIAPRAILIDHNRTSARTWAHRRAQGSKPRCRRTRCRPGSGSVSQRLVEMGWPWSVDNGWRLFSSPPMSSWADARRHCISNRCDT